jgi:hypothetical protein
MGLSSSLSRRSMLQISGMGALALTLPLPDIASGAASEAPPQFLRSSYLGHVGQTFAVVGGSDLVLTRVDDLARALSDVTLQGHEEAFALRFTGASALSSGVHALTHPELGSIALFISPVDQAGTTHAYDVVVDRTVRLARALDAPSDLASVTAPAGDLSPAAETTAERGTAVATSIAAARRAAARLRVRATARRTGRTVATELTFPGGGVQAVKVRLVRHGRTYARGTGAVTRGHADLRLKATRHLARGTYDLVVTATDRHAAATTVTRTVKVR